MKSPFQGLTALVLVMLAASLSLAAAPSESPLKEPIGGSMMLLSRSSEVSAGEMIRRLTAVEDTTLAGDNLLPDSITDSAKRLDPNVDWADFSSVKNLVPAIQPAAFEVGSFRFVPYGILWTDMIYSTSRTFPGFFVLWIESEELQGEDTMVIDARRSRVGVNITGPKSDLFGGITGGGKVEIDFFGGFVNPNTTDVRLRHVYWEAKNDNVRFLAGQTWDVVSPLLPSTVNFSVNWGVGNIGFRRTQIRMERYFHLSPDVVWTVQGAMAQNIIPDLTSGPLSEGVIRETGNWPMLQGRTALTFGGNGFFYKPVTVGVSGHLGETGFDFLLPAPGPAPLPPERDARFQEWSVNADVKMPITERFGFHGEFFTGENLSNLLGGILQGVCPCLRIPIRSTGGWGEFWYDASPNIHFHVGFGVDDPNNDDSLVGRSYNRVIYANVFLDLTDQLVTGLEVGTWKTLYQNKTLTEPDPDDRIAFPTAPGEATVIEWTLQYRF